MDDVIGCQHFAVDGRAALPNRWVNRREEEGKKKGEREGNRGKREGRVNRNGRSRRTTTQLIS